MVDSHSRGGDERGSAERLQIGAATRLIYYFPAESAPAIIARLRDLEVTGNDALDQRKGCLQNGIRADDLISALNFTKEEKVQEQLLDIFRRTPHSRIAVAALPGVPRDRDTEVLVKLKLFVKLLPDTEEGWDGEGFQLLNAVVKRFPRQSELLSEYAGNGGAQRRTTLCRVLREDWGKNLAAEVLVPLLTDKRPSADIRAKVKGVDLRVCDEAAITLAKHDPKVTFDPHLSTAEMDRQIKAILKKYGKDDRNE